MKEWHEKDVPETAADVSGLVEEYEDIAAEHGEDAVLQTDEIVNKLVKDHEWTPAGAAQLMNLVEKYGTYILRNALALAIALDREDGSEGL